MCYISQLFLPLSVTSSSTHSNAMLTTNCLALLLAAACLTTCNVVAHPNATLYYSHLNATASSAAQHALLNGSDSNGNTFVTTTKLHGGKYNTTSDAYDESEELDLDMLVPELGMSELTGTAPAFADFLQRTSVIFGLSGVSNDSNVNVACHKQLKRIQRGILHKEPWAMKVLDASGVKPSGFMFGQNFWLGSREACGAVQYRVGITLSKNYQRIMHDAIITERAPFDVDYRVVYLRHNSPWQVEIKVMSEEIIHIGLCLPSACSSQEIEQLTRLYLESGVFVENDIYDIRPQVVYMKDLQLRDSFYEKQTFKMMCAFVALTAMMLLIASFQRVKPHIEVKASDCQAHEEQTQTAPIVKHAEGVACDGNDDGVGFLHKLRAFAKCYDVLDNYDKLYTLKENVAREIPVINGLRSVCAIWIMLFHVMWYMYFTVNNKAFLLSYAERIFFQYVSSAPLLVDVFFTISGFLQTYNFLRNAKQMEIIRRNNFIQNVKHFLKLLFHRCLRLVPMYLVIIGTVDLFYAYIGDVSVYHISDRFDEKCTQYWWRNLLFIQNLYDHNDMCLNWTWSLACEMQYYILATVLLFTYAKNPRLVKGFTATAFVGTIIWTYSIGLDSQFQLSFDSAFATGTEIYISPFVRILPYILGAGSAWYLHERHTQLDMSETQEKCVWNLALLVFFSCIYSTIKRDMSVLSAISLFVIGRFLFSLSVCWMIVGSATGRGSWWSRMLEAKVFQHINRVSYGIYLLNPFVIAFFFSLTNASTHADPLMLCVLTCGFTVIVYLVSVLFSLAFEMPYCNWSGRLLKPAPKQKST